MNFAESGSQLAQRFPKMFFKTPAAPLSVRSVSSFATAKCKNKISESQSQMGAEWREGTMYDLSRSLDLNRDLFYGAPETGVLNYCGRQCKYRQ